MQIINNNTEKSFYVKFSDEMTGNNVSDIFLGAGNTVTVNVPAASCYMGYAYGDEWYGESALFGHGTIYAVSSEPIDFNGEYSPLIVVDELGSGNGSLAMTEINQENF